MRTKLVRTGNSRAVILPAAVLESQGWETGDPLEVEELTSGVVLRSVPRKSLVAAGKRAIRDHKTLMRELAK
jgi:antitoxin component of MazEF toxin-antitoxin module